MIRERLAGALVGAVALVGVAGSALAFVDANDDFFFNVTGSTLKIHISTLIANDTFKLRALGIRFVKAFKVPGQGIKSVTFKRNKGIIIVKFKQNFTSGFFKYRIAAVGDRPPGHDRDNAKVFINVVSAN